MLISDLMTRKEIDLEDIKYAVKLSSEKYIKECLKTNEMKNQQQYIELINKKTFDKLNVISVYSKIDGEELRKYIKIARDLINEEMRIVYNQIQKNLGTDTEIL